MLEDRLIATAHISPGETKNEECGFLLLAEPAAPGEGGACRAV